MLIVAGLQVPIIPLLEMAGKAGVAAPEQIGGMALKTGLNIGVTVTVITTAKAHWPEAGVKVKV